MKLQPNQTLLFIGDSITDTGRGRPVGERTQLGDGYVKQANALIQAAYPAHHIRVLNTGISGNRVTDLAARWKTDVLDLTPDWLSIMIGINDVWRHFDCEHMDQVDVATFESVYRELLYQTRPALKGLVLMTPYFIEPNRDDPMRKKMDQYGAVVRTLATDYDAVLVDTQAAFDCYLAHQPSQSLCGDRVHPNASGHMILARAFLDGVGFEWKK